MDVKEAVKAATDYLQDLYPDTPAEAVRLEEVEFGPDAWFITLSFLYKTDNAFEGLATGGLKRHYKVFTIDDESKKVLAMKIRQLEGA